MTDTQREIKFRAWDKKGRFEMAIVQIIDWIDKYVITTESWNEDKETGEADCDANFDDIELMQFTGLLDKNGKEIYVGDVLREFRIKSAPMANNGIDRKFTVEDIRDLDFSPDQCTIIGNIYENPELKRTNL